MNGISYRLKVASTLFLFILIGGCNSSSKPEWEKRNKELIEEYGLTVRELPDLPSSSVATNLEVGTSINFQDLDSLQLYPGVMAKIFWGNGNLVSVLELEPNSTIPKENVPADRFLILTEGSIDFIGDGNTYKMMARKREEPDGTHSGTPRIDFIYQDKGSQSEIVAGDTGAKVMEVYSPIRFDYLEKMGVDELPSETKEQTSKRISKNY